MNAPHSVGEVGALPPPGPPLIGREPELRLAQDILSRPHVRLLTLRGPGGVGKTSLALALAYILAPTFAQGVIWVDLAPLRDADQVVSAIARALRMPTPSMPELAAALRSASLLLVLDNFEHLTAAAPQVGALLAAAPGLRVLITSRTVLHLRGESQFAVAPLSLLQSSGSGLPSPAAQLFSVCAQAADPYFVLSEANRTLVERICTRLDGLPLALELAAARLNAVTLSGLLSWLAQPLDVLTDGPQDGPHHGQSLRSTIAWSYGLLTSPERHLLTACGGFVGGFTLPALEAVTGSQSRDTVLRLVEHSLLQSVDSPEPRWRLLEPIREFAAEQLTAQENAEQIHERHARYYLQLVEGAEHTQDLLKPEWQARLTADDANLQVAFHWFVERQRTPEALRLIRALEAYWEGASLHQVQYAWGTRALALPSSHVEPHLRAAVLCSLAYSAQNLGILDTAQQALQEALGLYRQLNDKAGELQVLRILATVRSGMGKYPEALELYAQIQAWFEAEHNDYLLSEVLHNTGALYLLLHHHDQALPYLLRAQLLAERTQYISGVAFILMLRAWIAYLDGDHAQLPERLNEAWTVVQRIQIPTLTARMLLVMACTAFDAGQLKLAALMLGLSEVLQLQVHQPWLPFFTVHVQRLEQQLGKKYASQRALGGSLGLPGLVEEIEAWLEGLGRASPEPEVNAVLTLREREVLQCLEQGASDKRIAQMLAISAGTVSKHVANMLGKLELHNRVELARWAAQQRTDSGQ